MQPAMINYDLGKELVKNNGEISKIRLILHLKVLMDHQLELTPKIHLEVFKEGKFWI